MSERKATFTAQATRKSGRVKARETRYKTDIVSNYAVTRQEIEMRKQEKKKAKVTA